MISNKLIDGLSDGKIAAALAPYGVAPSRDLCSAIRDYTVLLLRWNQRIGLTAIKDPASILARHFGESLFAASAVPLRSRRLVDVGSGAGFPGLALKLVLPETEVTLIEANAKKAAFLAEVIRTLRLRGVRLLRERTESKIGRASCRERV